MNRLDEAESTPRKRNTKQQQEAVAKDAVTKSGRKVKRPAHLDSPERALSASPSSEPRKSVAARATKATEPGYATRSPDTRATTKEQATSPEEGRVSRKTIASIKNPNSSKLDTPKGKAALESIVDDGAGVSKSGRKIKIPAKLAEFDSDVLSSPSRKHVVPDNDEPVKDKPTKTPSRTKTPAKSALKKIAVDVDDEVENKKAARKTPARRAKSVAPSDQPEEESVSTPRRRGVTSLFNKEMPPADLSHLKMSGKQMENSLLTAAANPLTKTPGRRAKSLAPAKDASNENDSKTPKKAIQKPGRRAGKSIANPGETSKLLRSESPSSEQEVVPKTPGFRTGKSVVPVACVLTLAVESPTAQRAIAKTPSRRRPLKSIADDKMESSVEPAPESVAAEDQLSRSGRKIKPKKVFDFEQNEKTIEQTADSSRKRKAENTEGSSVDTVMSPMKRKATASVGDAQQTPKLKNHLVSQTDNSASADGSVSRSGRKIKPKKMFGFEDNDSSANVFHITGSSPTVDEEFGAGGKSARNNLATKAKAVSTPSKARATSSTKIDREPGVTDTDQEMDDLVNETNESQTFITNRDIDDYRSPKHQHSRDETDRATAGSEPAIIRTSIGFGKPKMQKLSPLSKQRVEADVDCSQGTANVASPARNDVQLVGNSRSGQKIKPKKFFDTDTDATTSSDRPSAVSVKEKQTVPSSPKQKDAKEQEPEEERRTTIPLVNNTVGDEMMATEEEGVDIPEGPVKMLGLENEQPVKEPPEDDDEQKQPAEFLNAKPDGNVGEIELKKEVPEVEKEEEGKISDKTMVHEGITDALLVYEKSEEIPEKQQTEREEEGCSDDKSNLLCDVTVPDVVNSDGSDSVVQPVAADEEALPEALIENCSEKDTEVAHYEEAGCKTTIESKANECVEVIDATVETTLHDKDLSVNVVAVDDNKPEVVEGPREVPTDGINASAKTQNDAEMLAETSFGDIEYLEDEKSNIVDHIQKPVELSVPPSPPEVVAGRITLSPTTISSIVIIAETPAPASNVLNETFSPVVPSRALSSSGVTIIDITADTPRPLVAAAAPHTPDSKLLAKQKATEKCSPDKPPAVIEIMDSPAVAAFCKQIDDEAARGTDSGSATSTPLAVRSALLQHQHEYVNDEQQQQQQQQNERRKRSLSASAADMTMKRNVTFYSPANCTMLVETIDERMMLKSLEDQQQQQQDTMESSSCSKGIGEKLRKPRKRSLSEHKPSELKRNKVSKLPNFKSIHANHFKRMESVADFMKRKESRAKQILSSCSPATKLLSNVTTDAAEKPSCAVTSAVNKIPQSTTKPFVFKSAGGGGMPVQSSVVAGLFVKRTKGATTAAGGKSAGGPGEDHHQTLSATATGTAASTAKKPVPSDTERMANRLKQFQTTFKPKQIGTGTADKTTASTSQAAVGVRPVEQLRSKQSKILKGVRTNRRFELQMKHRDNVQHQ